MIDTSDLPEITVTYLKSQCLAWNYSDWPKITGTYTESTVTYLEIQRLAWNSSEDLTPVSDINITPKGEGPKQTSSFNNNEKH